MNTAQEKLAPEVIQALITNASANGLSINDYLRSLLGLKNEGDQDIVPSTQNEAMLKALESIREILEDVPVRGSTEESLRILREGRAGRMWGYDPNK